MPVGASRRQSRSADLALAGSTGTRCGPDNVVAGHVGMALPRQLQATHTIDCILPQDRYRFAAGIRAAPYSGCAGQRKGHGFLRPIGASSSTVGYGKAAWTVRAWSCAVQQNRRRTPGCVVDKYDKNQPRISQGLAQKCGLQTENQKSVHGPVIRPGSRRRSRSRSRRSCCLSVRYDPLAIFVPEATPETIANIAGAERRSCMILLSRM